MVANFPGPWELRFSYTTNPSGHAALSHSQHLNVDLTTDPGSGDAFSNIQAKVRDGLTTPDLASVVEAWLAVLGPLFNTGAAFGNVELWKYSPLSFQAVFVSSYSPTLVAGTSATVTGVAQQDVWTLRTQEGGILKINLMECAERAYSKNPYPAGGAAVQILHDFVKSGPNWILGRDTSYPFSALNFLVGQNEKLFNLRFRP